jgi:DNA-binding MarR family transcriptional regulator
VKAKARTARSDDVIEATGRTAAAAASVRDIGPAPVASNGHDDVLPAQEAAAQQAPALVSPELDDATIGLEARVVSDDHFALKLWLRLLACATQIETEIKRRLRKAFGITIARFDYLAQLHRYPDGLRMNVLSRYLMVTGGSITGLTDELQKEGLVLREDAPDDRRAFVLRLTPQGRDAFERIAAQHEAWTIELFSGIAPADRRTLFDLLGHLRFHTAANTSEALLRGLPLAAEPVAARAAPSAPRSSASADEPGRPRARARKPSTPKGSA